MEWAAKDTHLRGIPRRIVMSAGGALTKLVASLLNNTQVHNKDTLLHLIKSRPSGTPLITVSNHMSTLDDPLMWGFKGSPVMDWKRARWTLTAEDICFTNPLLSYFFRLGKCIPITRGAGIYQTNMNEALDRINEGEWLHTFPEGKISQERGPIRRLKWGTASLIVRASVTPIVLPIAHSGFEKKEGSIKFNFLGDLYSCCRGLQSVNLLGPPESSSGHLHYKFGWNSKSCKSRKFQESGCKVPLPL